MIVVIADPEDGYLKELLKRLDVEYHGEEVVQIQELGRCIVPIEKKERDRIAENAVRGKELVRRANHVYLLREGRAVQLK